MNRSKAINFQPFMLETRPPLTTIPIMDQLVEIGERSNQKWSMTDRLFFAIRKINPIFVTSSQIPSKFDYTILQMPTQLIASLKETLLFLAFSYYLREYQDKVGQMKFYPVAMKNMIPIVNYLKDRVHNNFDTTLEQAYRQNVVHTLFASDAFDLLSGMIATTRLDLIQRTRICPELLNVLNKMSFILIYAPNRPSILSWKNQS
uniref:VP11 n=1 Tax=Scylla paramamosain reovirus TaxID=1226329 RepID=A0AA96SJI6_9REOV|nr:VP11 [Scylla paramamosain reovirus]